MLQREAMQPAPLPIVHVRAETLRQVVERVGENAARVGSRRPGGKPAVRVVDQEPAGDAFGLLGEEFGGRPVESRVGNRLRPVA